MSDEADGLVAFLRDRIAEDVAAASAAYRPGGDGPWVVDVSPSGRATVWQRRPEREAASALPPDVHLAPVVGTAQIDNGREVCEHIARFDPVRVLADATANGAPTAGGTANRGPAARRAYSRGHIDTARTVSSIPTGKTNGP